MPFQVLNVNPHSTCHSHRRKAHALGWVAVPSMGAAGERSTSRSVPGAERTPNASEFASAAFWLYLRKHNKTPVRFFRRSRSVRVAWAFFRRDIQIAASYPFSFLLPLAGGLVTLTIFYFLAASIGEAPGVRQRYGADYFSFALVGISVASALRAVQTTFAQRVREAQTDGSLEVLLAAPLSTFRVISLLSLYPIALAGVRSLALLGVGAFLYGAQLDVSWSGLLGSAALGMLTFAPLGLLSAAFVLSFKRADPFGYLLDVTSYLFAGVLYPVDVLPAALQKLSVFLPATHALRSLRRSVLNGQGPAELLDDWGLMVLFAAMLWPLAAVALEVARRHIERVGTLPHA